MKKVLSLLAIGILTLGTKAQLVTQQFNTGFSSSLWQIKKTPGDRYFAAGNSGNLFEKQLGCNTWTKVDLSSGVTQSFRDISFPSSSIGYVSGTSGRVIKTTDGGNSWNTLNTGTTAALVNTQFINDNLGFISGGGTGGKIIYKTTDGGINWTDVTPSGLTSTPYDMAFPNSTDGYAVCTNGQILKTNNSGDTWQTIHPANSGISSLYSMSMINDSTFFACGASGTIVKTTDYGNTFTTLNSTTTSFLWKISFYDEQTGIALGSGGKVLLTQDGGLNWSLQSYPITSTVRAIDWTGPNEGYISGSNATLVKFNLNQNFDVLFSESFCSPTDSVSYYGWTNSGIANVNEKWRFDNPNTNGVGYTMNGNFAIFDGQYYQNTLSYIDEDSSYIESPAFSTVGYNTLSLSWHEAYLCNYLGDVYTRIDGFDGSNWVTLFESNGVEINGTYTATYTSPAQQLQSTRAIDASAIAGTSNAKIRFTYYSTNNTSIKFWWAIDDIVVSSKSHDISLSNLSLSPGNQNSCQLSASEELNITFTNTGQQDVFPIEWQYQVNNGPVKTGAYYGSLKSQEDTAVTLGTEDFSTTGVYDIKVWKRKMLDRNLPNDTINFSINTGNSFSVNLGNDTSICPNDSISLNIDTTPFDSYVWSNGSNTNNIVVGNSGWIWLEAISQGCQKRDSMLIDLKPTPPFLNLSGDTAFCAGEGTSLSSSTDSTLWSNGTVGNVFNVNQSGNYWAVSYLDGCYHADTAFFQTNALPLPNKPTIDPASDSNICNGSSLKLKINSPHGTYKWNTDAEEDSIVITSTGAYYAKVSDGVCWSINSDTVHIQVIPNPTQPIININDNELSVSSTYDTYQWYKDGNAILGATQATYTITETAMYAVQVFNSECENKSVSVQVEFKEPSSIGDINASNVNAFPNPASDRIKIESDSKIQSISVVDLKGEVKILAENINTKTCALSLDLKSGLYILITQTANHQHLTKILIR